MSEFRRLTDTFLAAPQIAVGDIADAKALGVTLVINNRPEGEADDQTGGAEIEAASRAAGLDYTAIPITHAGFSEPQVAAMRGALDSAGGGKVLAYCRSGTRSTLLWALAQSSRGDDPAELTDIAAAAGYDVAPIRPAMDALAARARG